MTVDLTRLTDLVVEVNERNPRDGAEVFSVSEGRGIIPQREIFTKQIATDDRSKYRCIQYGDVVFNPYLLWNRAVGVCFHQKGGCVSPAYPVLRPKHENTERFLHYFFRSPTLTSAVDAIATGSVTRRRTAPLKDILDLTFNLPVISDQRAANRLLHMLDDKIEMNRRMNATLVAMARALFQSWFVDFDPVRAKLDGRPPMGLDPETVALFPATFQDSPLGHIPEGWEIGSILRQADLLSGGTPKTNVASYWNGDVPWASAKDVSQCGEAFLLSTERMITKLGVEKSSTKIIPAFATVVVARGATTGRLTMFGDSIAMNQTCYGLQSKFEAPFALYSHARQFIERLVQGGHGSVFDTITTSTFEATEVLLPPKELLLAFDKKVTPLFNKILANLHQSRTLVTLRDTLLPKLISGELSVPEHITEITT